MRFLLPLLLCASAVFADTCADLHALKNRTYGFRPSQLTEPQRQLKSGQMDRFWNLARGRGPAAAACLRAMLASETADRFFLFDAASLLFRLDQSPDSLAAVAGALSRADLGEVDPAGYVELALALAQRGVDTGPLAANYMTYPKVDAVVPQHALQLDRPTGAVFLYGSMDPALAGKYLVPLLNSHSQDVRATAAMMLALNLTEGSYRALAGLGGVDDLPAFARKQVIAAMAYHPADATTVPAYSREQVLARIRALPHTSEQVNAELQKEHPRLGITDDEPLVRSAIATLTDADLDTLRQARRSSLTAVSDEALYEYAAFTRILLGVINRLDLYKEYRVH